MPNPLLSQLDDETRQRLLLQAEEAVRQGIPAEQVARLLDENAEQIVKQFGPKRTFAELGESVGAPGLSALGFLGDLIAPTPENLLALPASFVTGPGVGKLAAKVLPNAGIRRLAVRFLTKEGAALRGPAGSKVPKVVFNAADAPFVKDAFGGLARITEEPTLLLSLSRAFGFALPFATLDAAEAITDDESPAGAFATTVGAFAAIDAVLFVGLPRAGRQISKLFRRRVTEAYARNANDPFLDAAFSRIDGLRTLAQRRFETPKFPIPEGTLPQDIDDRILGLIEKEFQTRRASFNEAIDDLGRAADASRKAASTRRGQDAADDALADAYERAITERIELEAIAAEDALAAQRAAGRGPARVPPGVTRRPDQPAEFPFSERIRIDATSRAPLTIPDPTDPTGKRQIPNLTNEAIGEIAERSVLSGRTLPELEAELMETLIRRSGGAEAGPSGGGLPRVAQAIDEGMRVLEVESPKSAQAVRIATQRAESEGLIGSGPVDETIKVAILGEGRKNTAAPAAGAATRSAQEVTASTRGAGSASRPKASQLATDAETAAKSPRAAPPGRPTGTETVPETNETLAAQLTALRRGDKPAVLLPSTKAIPKVDRRIFETTTIPNGIVIAKRNQTPSIVKNAARTETALTEPELARVLGLTGPKPPPGTPSTVVTGRTAAGHEAISEVTSPHRTDAAARNASRVAGPGGTVEIGTEDQAARVLAERTADLPPLTRGVAVHTPSGTGTIINPAAGIGVASVRMSDGKTALFDIERLTPFIPERAPDAASSIARAAAGLDPITSTTIRRADATAEAALKLSESGRFEAEQLRRARGIGPSGIPRDPTIESRLTAATRDRIGTENLTGRRADVTSPITRAIDRRRATSSITISPGDHLFIGRERLVARTRLLGTTRAPTARLERILEVVRISDAAKGDPTPLLVFRGSMKELEKKGFRVSDRFVGASNTPQEAARLSAAYEQSLATKRTDRDLAARLTGAPRNPDAAAADTIYSETVVDGAVSRAVLKAQRRNIGVTTQAKRLGPQFSKRRTTKIDAERVPDPSPEVDQNAISEAVEIATKPPIDAIDNVIDRSILEAGQLGDFSHISSDAAIKRLATARGNERLSAFSDLILSLRDEGSRKGLIVDGFDTLALDDRAVAASLRGEFTIRAENAPQPIRKSTIGELKAFIDEFDPKDESLARRLFADRGAGVTENRNRSGGC